MLPSLAYYIEPLWSIGPMVLFTLTFIIVTFYVFRYKHTRTSVGYAALIGVLAGFIYNTIAMATALRKGDILVLLIEANPAIFLLYTIYLVFAFAPGLIVFGQIANRRSKNGSKIGKYIVYFGDFYSTLIIAIGLALTVISATTFWGKSRYQVYSGDTMMNFLSLLGFMYYCGWGFIALFLIFFAMYFKELEGKARTTFIAYCCLNLLSVLVFTITATYEGDYDDGLVMISIVFSVLFALSDAPVAILFIIAIYYGHIWDLEVSEDKVEIDDDENTVHYEELATRRLNY